MAKLTAYPFFEMDVSKMMSEFKVPGVDIDAIMATQRKIIEAVTAANQLAIEGMKAVVRRQAEILRQTMEETSSMITEMMGAGTPEDKMAKQELVQFAIVRAYVCNQQLKTTIFAALKAVFQMVIRTTSSWDRFGVTVSLPTAMRHAVKLA